MSTRCQIEFFGVPYPDYKKPAARIYKHSDGYPSGILPMLRYLESVLSADIPMYGPRNTDPEWAASEFVSQFRAASDAKPGRGRMGKYGRGKLVGKVDGDPFYQYKGGIYVTQEIHGDIEYLYRVVCAPRKWTITIWTPLCEDATDAFKVTGWKHVNEEGELIAPQHPLAKMLREPMPKCACALPHIHGHRCGNDVRPVHRDGKVILLCSNCTLGEAEGTEYRAQDQ